MVPYSLYILIGYDINQVFLMLIRPLFGSFMVGFSNPDLMCKGINALALALVKSVKHFLNHTLHTELKIK
jgi:hypothetical protein